MKNQKSILVSLIFAILCSLSCKLRQPHSALRGDENAAEIEDSDLKKDVELLLGMREFVPELFEEAAQYGVNLLDLLRQQRALLQQLNALPGYQSELAKKPDLVGFKIELEGDRQVTSRTIDPNVLATWRSSLEEQLTALGAEPNLQRRLLSAISKESQTATLAQGLFTGLINSLPKERRGALFAMNYADRIRALQSELTNEALAAGFKPSMVGLGDQTYTVAEVMNILADRINSETKFTSLIELHIVLQNIEGKISDSFDEHRQTLSNLGEGALDSFTDPVMFRKISEVFTQQFDAQDKAVLATLRKSGNDLVRKHAISITTKTIENQTAVDKVLYLYESPILLALVRGMLAGDCASECSSGYVNSPAERVFYVYDADRKGKGYLSTTKNEVESRANLFSHTIAGKRLTTGDTLLILNALADRVVTENFGVASLSLPTKENLAGLINFAAAREPMAKLIAANSGHVKPMIYPDSKFREVIDQSVQISSYDSHTSNTETVVIQNIPDDLKIRVTAIDSPLAKFKPRALTKPEAFLLALDLYKIHQPDAGQKVAKLVGITREEIETIYTSLLNKDHLSVADFTEQVRGSFGRNGVEVNSITESRFAPLLRIGRLVSQDAFSQEYAQETHDILLAQLQRGDFAGMKELFEYHRVSLGASEKLGAYAERSNWGAEKTAKIIRFIVEHLPDERVTQKIFNLSEMRLGDADQSVQSAAWKVLLSGTMEKLSLRPQLLTIIASQIGGSDQLRSSDASFLLSHPSIRHKLPGDVHVLLERAFNSEDSTTREHVMKVYEAGFNIDNQRVIALLTRAISDPSTVVKGLAIKAIANLNNAPGDAANVIVDSLMNMTGDSYEERTTAGNCITTLLKWKVVHPNLTTFLLRKLSDPNRIDHGVYGLLALVKPPPEEFIRALLIHVNREVVPYAAPDDNKAAAIRFLGEMRVATPEVFAALVGVTQSAAIYWIRKNAFVAMIKTWPNDRRVVSLLMSSFESTDSTDMWNALAQAFKELPSIDQVTFDRLNVLGSQNNKYAKDVVDFFSSKPGAIVANLESGEINMGSHLCEELRFEMVKRKL